MLQIGDLAVEILDLTLMLRMQTACLRIHSRSLFPRCYLNRHLLLRSILLSLFLIPPCVRIFILILHCLFVPFINILNLIITPLVTLFSSSLLLPSSGEISLSLTISESPLSPLATLSFFTIFPLVPEPFNFTIRH